jgi:hypothetical protein
MNKNIRLAIVHSIIAVPVIFFSAVLFHLIPPSPFGILILFLVPACTTTVHLFLIGSKSNLIQTYLAVLITVPIAAYAVIVLGGIIFG